MIEFLLDNLFIYLFIYLSIYLILKNKIFIGKF